jgi:outer membrane receptor protein involved in Fe transport
MTLLPLAVCILFAGAAHAQDGAGADGQLQRVEIAGPGSVALRRGETVAKIVVGRADIVQFGDSSLAEVLKRQPGISVVGGQVRMRGLGSGYTQILINGDPVPQGFSIDSISPELIERIEILRSAAADQSAQAVAGSINLILRKSVANAQREYKIGTGAERGRWSPSASMQLGDRRGALSYSLAATLGRTMFAETPHTLERVEGAGGTALAVREFDEWNRARVDRLNLAPRLNWALDNGDTLGWQNLMELSRAGGYSGAHERTLYGQSTSYPDNDAFMHFHTSSLRSDLAWAHRTSAGGKLDLKTRLDANRRRTAYLFRGFAPAGAPGLARAVDSTADENGGAVSGKYVTPLNAQHSLGIGWDASRVTRGETRLQTDGALGQPGQPVLDQDYMARVRKLALFAQDEWEINARLQAYLGLRWEGLQSTTEGRNFAQVQNRSAVWSPTMQVLWKLPDSEKDQLRLALARTYKAPLTRDLVPRRYTVNNDNSAANPDVEGNPALRPELSWGLDLAYETYFGKGGMASVSGFARHIQDVTLQRLYRQNGKWIGRPENDGSAVAAGIEFDARSDLRSWLPGALPLEVRVNAARNWSRLDSVPGPYNRLADQAPASANVGLDYRPADNWSGGFNLNYQGGGTSRSSAQSSSYAGARCMLELYGVRKMAARTRLRVSVTNALRQDRRTAQVYADADGSLSQRTVASGSTGARVTLEQAL